MMIKRWLLGCCVAASGITAVGVGLMLYNGQGHAIAATDRATDDIGSLKAIYQRAAVIPTPTDNPMSKERVELGRTLFFDANLSADRTTSCGTCHVPSMAWRDGLAKGAGHDGKPLARHTPTIVNVAWAPLLTWDGRMNSLEMQALDPIRNPRIGNEPIPDLVARLQSDGPYKAAFASAFGDDIITLDRIAKSIAGFERSVVSSPAAFDRWVEGDETAISPQAKHGFVLFNGKGNCAACHSGWRFTDDSFHDVGLPSSSDLGRGGKVDGGPTYLHNFKTPTLRGASVVGPYMHDGSLATLEAVVDHYAGGGMPRESLDPMMQPIAFTLEERSDLIAFLGTLSATGDKS